MQECKPEREREKENEIKVGRKCALTGIIYKQANITGTKIRTRMRMCTFLTKIRTATTSAAKAHWNWRRRPLRTTVKRSMSVSRQCQACCCGGCDCVYCTCGWAKEQQWECIWDESQTSISHHNNSESILESHIATTMHVRVHWRWECAKQTTVRTAPTKQWECIQDESVPNKNSNNNSMWECIAR